MTTLAATTRIGRATLAPSIPLTGLYVGITLTLPGRIAARLPRIDGNDPHITLAGPALVTPAKVEEVHAAFDRGLDGSALEGIEPFAVRLQGVGDFRAAEPASQVVYVAVTDGADRIRLLARRFNALLDNTPTYACVPHTTVCRNESEKVLDRFAAVYADFDDEFVNRSFTVTTGHGPIGARRHITWHQPRTYLLR